MKFKDKILIPLLWTVGSFFAARCMLFDIILPFGTPYCAVTLDGWCFAPVVLSAVLGVVSRAEDMSLLSPLLALGVLVLVKVLLKVSDRSLTLRGKAAAVLVSQLVGGLTGAIYAGADKFSLIIAFLQALLGAVLTVLFEEGVQAFKSGGGTELYGMSLLIGCVCGGMDGTKPFGIPLALFCVTAFLPLAMGKRVLTSVDGIYLRQRASGRISGFAGAMQSLAESVESIVDTDEKPRSREQLKRGLAESRAMLGRELKAVAALMRRLSVEISEELAPDTYLSKALKKRLKSEGVGCDSVLVYSHGDSYEVSLTRRCRGNCAQCIKKAAAAASREIGADMVRADSFCKRDGRRFTLSLSSRRRYRISAYAMAKKRDGSSVSGDSHTFMELEYGKYMLALSDGMGSGGRARAESAASVELFEEFMEAGFERDTALEQINSLLLMRAGGEDIFATLDICNVDLYSGVAEFVKIGGMPSFVASGDGVRIVGGGGLPVGIVEKAEKESAELSLHDGDMIVMVTDGITDTAPCAVGKENWLAGIIDEHRTVSPEGMCQAVINAAIAADNGKIKDDMTVMAARIFKV